MKVLFRRQWLGVWCMEEGMSQLYSDCSCCAPKSLVLKLHEHFQFGVSCAFTKLCQPEKGRNTFMY